MIIQNAPGTANTTINQPYVIPTVHSTSRPIPRCSPTPRRPAPRRASARAVQQPNVIAPVMGDFSSRGPNLANANILKPDITAPGARHHRRLGRQLADPGAARRARPRTRSRPAANANAIQGTSMASPHVAGAAALAQAAASDLVAGGDQVGADDHDQQRQAGQRCAGSQSASATVPGHLNPNPAGDPGSGLRRHDGGLRAVPVRPEPDAAGGSGHVRGARLDPAVEPEPRVVDGAQRHRPGHTESLGQERQRREQHLRGDGDAARVGTSS